MDVLDLGENRIAALTLLFVLLTVGVAVLVGIMYLVFARLIRQSEAEAARHDRSVVVPDRPPSSPEDSGPDAPPKDPS